MAQDRSGGSTNLSLELPKGQSFDEWLEVGRNLASASKVLNWWIGDWWAAGSHRYGERAKVAAEGIFGLTFSSLATYASVARSFESSRRLEHLSFAHHQEVAALDPEQADELLKRAARDRWTVKDIRAEAATLRSIPGGGAFRDTSREVLEWSALRGAWNRASITTREQFLGALNGTEAIE